MNQIIKLSIFTVLLGFLVACSNEKKEQDSSSEVIEQKELEVHDKSEEVIDHGYEMAMTAYQCPMKCEGEKTYREEGTCPKCKMDLKEIEVASNEGPKEEE